MGKIINVLVVDDSALARNFITNGLAQRSDIIKVVGTAVDADDARVKILSLKPDVVTIDVEMPKVNGIDFVKSFLPEYPIPFVLVSSLNIRIFEALSAGAVDFVKKPDGVEKKESFLKNLTEKIVVASCANVKRRIEAKKSVADTQAALRQTTVAKKIEAPTVALPKICATADIDSVFIAIGASAGGTEATTRILNMLPPVMPPIVVVQHMPAGFTKMYADTLNRTCALNVQEAADGMEIKQSNVYIAPAELQSRVKVIGGKYVFSCEHGEKVSGHRPSVDAFFLSVAQNVKCKTIGVILTGMGSDGAEGLLEMRKKGAYTIGQNEETCVVYGMPKVAFNLGAVQHQVAKIDVAKMIITGINSYFKN